MIWTIFANSRPSSLNFKTFSRTLEQFFLTVGQNNFGDKIPYFLPEFVWENLVLAPSGCWAWYMLKYRLWPLSVSTVPTQFLALIFFSLLLISSVVVCSKSSVYQDNPYESKILIRNQSFQNTSHTTYRKNNNLEKCAGMGLNGFHIKLKIGTYCNWKNQNPGSRFGATS